MHWRPQERDEAFNPLQRHSDWSAHLRRRFAVVAGAEQEALGYPVEPVEQPSSTADNLASQYQQLTARAIELKSKAGRARRALGRVHGRI
jgi:hypothetical protein